MKKISHLNLSSANRTDVKGASHTIINALKYRALSLAIILVMVCVAFASCSQRDKRTIKNMSVLTPASSGNPYEVMVVAEDSIWDGYVGASLREVLETPMEGLPQEEPSFKVSHVTPKHYDRITNLFRNVVLIKIDNREFTKAKMKITRDVYSSPQAIMTLQGPDVVDVSTFITENKMRIVDFFNKEEINREAEFLEANHNIKFAKEVKDMFDCELYIPVDINKMKVGKDFIWASNDAASGNQNIVIYSYPYVSRDVFNRGVYVALRDSFMKVNIPGSEPDMYMTTTKPTVTVKDIKARGEYAQEARGLWEMQNDMMGGPFVAHSVVDTINGKIIVAEGFVYAPEKMKRNMIRKLEAALYTLKVPGKAEEAETDKEQSKE